MWGGRPFRRLVRLPIREDRLARDVADEVAFHFDSLVEHLMRLGLSRDEAVREATAEFGDPGDVRAASLESARGTERARDRSERAAEALGDVRTAWRSLRRDWGFALAATAMLTVGIGASTTLFSVAFAVLARPLPYPNGDRAVVVWNSYPQAGLRKASVAAAELADLREGVRALSLSAVRTARVELSGGCRTGGSPCGAAEVTAYMASPELHESLGLLPRLGRGFTRTDGQADATPVVILSDALWRSRYDADTTVIGRVVMVAAQARTIIGVLPPAMRFPEAPIGYLRERADLWVPYDWARDQAQGRGNQVLAVIGFLRPGFTLATAQREVDAVAARFRSTYPDRYARDGQAWQLTLRTLREEMVGDVRQELVLLMGAVTLLLLLACVNVAGLLLARGAARVREMAVRRALGAGRSRLVRQLLAEAAVLTAMGATGGTVLAWGCTTALVLFDADHVPRLADTSLNGTVLLVGIVVGAACTFLFGLVPAMRQASSSLDALREGPHTGTSGPPRHFLHALVSAEIGMTTVLLVGAGLVGRSFARLQDVETGMDKPAAITFQVALPRFRYDSAWKVRDFHRALTERLEATGTFSRTGAVYPLPMSGDAWSGTYHITNQPYVDGDPKPHAEYNVAAPGYFGAMGIRLLAGREFEATDTESSPPVAIIDSTLAARHWPGGSAIGECINPNQAAGTCVTVVGVVRHVRTAGPRHPGEPQVYLPLAQRAERRVSYAVVPRADHPTAIAGIHQAVAAVDPDLPVSGIRTMEAVIAGATAPERFLLFALAAFAASALVLAGYGLFGVMSYAVVRRRHELGVRLALGAAGHDIMNHVLRSAVRTAGIGLGLGIPGALAFAGLMEARLFGVQRSDPLTFAAVLAVVSVVTLAAAWVPARRAAAVDPLLTLRR